jgi:hypothetical protein
LEPQSSEPSGEAAGSGAAGGDGAAGSAAGGGEAGSGDGDAEAGRRSAMDRNESPVACAMRVMAYGLLQELLLLPE